MAEDQKSEATQMAEVREIEPAEDVKEEVREEAEEQAAAPSQREQDLEVMLKTLHPDFDIEAQRKRFTRDNKWEVPASMKSKEGQGKAKSSNTRTKQRSAPSNQSINLTEAFLENANRLTGYVPAKRTQKATMEDLIRGH